MKNHTPSSKDAKNTKNTNKDPNTEIGKTVKPVFLPDTSKDLDDIFATLNGSGAHACYCERSTDGGCTCALKDEYLEEAKAKVNRRMAQECTNSRIGEIDDFIAMFGMVLTPHQLRHLNQRKAALQATVNKEEGE